MSNIFCPVPLSLQHAERLVSHLWSVAEHDKMTKGNQILSLGNVNYKMKKELNENTGNKSQNIYTQRGWRITLWGHVMAKAERDKEENSAGSQENTDQRKKPEAACREKQEPVEWIRPHVCPFRELNGLWSCFDSRPRPALLL